jgi:hypothetical protein
MYDRVFAVAVCSMLAASCGSSTAGDAKPTPPVEPTTTTEESPVTSEPADNAPKRVALSVEEGTPVEIDGSTLSVKSVIFEELEEAPDEPGSGGSVVIVNLELDGEQFTVSDGPDGKKDGWVDSFRVRLHEGHMGAPAKAELYIDKLAEQASAAIYKQATVLRRKHIELDDGMIWRFLGHGHKSVSPGQSSPLMISWDVLRGDHEIDEGQLSILPPEEKTWRWRDYHFELVEHDYDKSMTLAIRRVALVPVAAAAE